MVGSELFSGDTRFIGQHTAKEFLPHDYNVTLLTGIGRKLPSRMISESITYRVTATNARASNERSRRLLRSSSTSWHGSRNTYGSPPACSE